MSKREKMRLRRAYDEWTETETENREHGGLLLVASGTSTRQHTLSLHRSAHSAGRQHDEPQVERPEEQELALSTVLISSETDP